MRDDFNNHADLSCPHATCSSCDGDVVQIMPAPGWCAWWFADHNHNEAPEVWSSPLVGWALTRSGTVMPMTTDALGDVQPGAPEDCNTMICIRHETDLYPPPTVESATQEIRERRARMEQVRAEWAKKMAQAKKPAGS